MSEALAWVDITYNNTYGVQLINETVYNQLILDTTDPSTGCIATTRKCREVAAIGDPDFYANNQTVNDVCAIAVAACFPLLVIAPEYANRQAFDMAQVGPQSFPLNNHVTFFNQRWVQQSLGVGSNFTAGSNLTDLYFTGTADALRRTQANLELFLENSIQVALVYGDRDTRCPWNGVENISLTLDYSEAPNFRAAGYADLTTAESHYGGVVRQYDGLSFSRIFDAGHQLSSFQPEVARTVFERVMFRRDVATGNVTVNTNMAKHYQSKGPASSFGIKNVLPPSPKVECNLWAAPSTCDVDQLEALANGTAETTAFLVTSPAT